MKTGVTARGAARGLGSRGQSVFVDQGNVSHKAVRVRVGVNSQWPRATNITTLQSFCDRRETAAQYSVNGLIYIRFYRALRRAGEPPRAGLSRNL
jgi:hypothetical protein